jgi:mRNA interferase RelE/StbE
VFEILLERSAKRDLGRLPQAIHDRIVRALNALSTNPRPRGCRKLSESKNDWRIRVGDYRVIYEIADADHVVRVNRVRHRREVYR